MAEILVDAQTIEQAIYAIESLLEALGIDFEDDPVYETIYNDLQNALNTSKGDD
ncbi:hypothetical protein [Bacillus sp. NSP9.1]|uniref:hypothetical protein n=1 Tax=Bacillus sp. NSP9.1 TaxID=1071078 RepID=UPI000426846D|nr:hypothetical protein [Bacillus sp. NSP9.1]QHZ45867.1 hypothetical protein M654_005815 [Bacillus sp. NSP9.1]